MTKVFVDNDEDFRHNPATAAMKLPEAVQIMTEKDLVEQRI
jgi:hypothetical protein